jgi:hypothetical protein
MKYKAQYLLMNTLVKLLMNAERNEEAQIEIEKLLDSDLLIIDESFDTKKLTIYKSGYQIPFLDSFIRDRINKQKGIIFISNVDSFDIDKNIFGISLYDLINRQIELDKSNVHFPSVYRDKKIIDNKGLFS